MCAHVSIHPSTHPPTYPPTHPPIQSIPSHPIPSHPIPSHATPTPRRAAPRRATPHCTALHRTTPHHTIPYHNMLQTLCSDPHRQAPNAKDSILFQELQAAVGNAALGLRAEMSDLPSDCAFDCHKAPPSELTFQSQKSSYMSHPRMIKEHCSCRCHVMCAITQISLQRTDFPELSPIGTWSVGVSLRTATGRSLKHAASSQHDSEPNNAA